MQSKAQGLRLGLLDFLIACGTAAFRMHTACQEAFIYLMKSSLSMHGQWEQHVIKTVK